MNNLTEFKSPPQCLPLEQNGEVVGTISIGGSELHMPISPSRYVLFEMHSYLGPVPLNKKTGELLERVPRKFWDCYKRWELGGKLVDGETCHVPDWCHACKGSGCEVDMSSKRSGVVKGKCKACHGSQLHDK